MDIGTGREELTAIVREAIATMKRYATRPDVPEWAQLDLTMGQLKALMVLGPDKRMTISELAHTLRLGKPSASILVDRLVQMGLATRVEDPDDRRRTLVATTTQGADLVIRLHQGQIEQFVSLLNRLSDEDLAAFARGMRALARVQAEEHAAREETVAAQART